LPGIITRNGTDKDIGIDGNLHFSPAQPSAAASLIHRSWQLSLSCPPADRENHQFFRKDARLSERLGLPANSSNVIFSPGLIAKVFQHIFPKVTWPRA